MNLNYLSDIFSVFFTHKHALHNVITIDYVTALIQDKNTTNSIEALEDKITYTLHDHKKKSFIKSLKTQKYIHLFNDEVEKEINIILENKYNHLIERSFFNTKGNVFKFVGIVKHDDGFYYELRDINTNKKELHCCLGSLKDSGFNITYSINKS